MSKKLSSQIMLVLMSIVLTTIAVTTYFDKSGINDMGYILSEQLKMDISVANITARNFIELECSLNSLDGLKNLDKVKALMTEDAFREHFENSERLMNLPQSSDLKVSSVEHVAVQPGLDDSGYKVLAVIKESNSAKTYPSTYVINITKDYLVDSYIKIPHLK